MEVQDLELARVSNSYPLGNRESLEESRLNPIIEGVLLQNMATH